MSADVTPWHSSSVFGLEGIEAQAWFGVAFVIVMLGGFYLWYWPRMRAWAKVFVIRRGRGRYRWHLDLHNAVGIVTIVPLLLITITGIDVAFPARSARSTTHGREPRRPRSGEDRRRVEGHPRRRVGRPLDGQPLPRRRLRTPSSAHGACQIGARNPLVARQEIAARW